MKMIIFVHGMGHNPRKDYWRSWAEPLKKALLEERIPVEANNFGGVYYYDLVPGPKEEIKKQIFLRELRRFAFKELLARNCKKRGIIKKLVDYLVDNFGDIYSYLYIDEVYEAVNSRVYESLVASNHPVCLLGYSLGAIVCYCALQASPFLAGRVTHFLMLGNPLFWFARRVALRANLHTRPPVGYWTNIAAIADIAIPWEVPRFVRGLDENIEFVVDRFNPIRAHTSYFTACKSLRVIASSMAGQWRE